MTKSIQHSMKKESEFHDPYDKLQYVSLEHTGPSPNPLCKIDIIIISHFQFRAGQWPFQTLSISLSDISVLHPVQVNALTSFPSGSRSL